MAGRTLSTGGCGPDQMQGVISGHLLPPWHSFELPCVCMFVRAVSRLVVGMPKGCVQHLEVDFGRRWGDRKEELLGGGRNSNQMRVTAHSGGIRNTTACITLYFFTFIMKKSLLSISEPKRLNFLCVCVTILS